MRRRRNLWIGIGVALAIFTIALAIPPIRRQFHPLLLIIYGKQTVEQKLAEFAPAQARLRPLCDEQGIAFPPTSITLLALKQERRLEVFAGSVGQPLKFLQRYSIQAASGTIGPKLREGDRQVPEGIYPLESLNPNSKFHAALRVGYPNARDLANAKREGRDRLGGDIMIHGGAASVGCLAMGDPAIEELFTLAALAGAENVTIVISPVDLRTTALQKELSQVDSERYEEIRNVLSGLHE